MAFGTAEKKIKSGYLFLSSPIFTAATAAKFLTKRMVSKGYLSLPWKEKAWMKYRAPLRLLNRLASVAMEAPVRIKADHTDAARLMDIDSWEDWSFMNGMMHAAEDPNEVYPYWDDLKKFAQFESYFVENGVQMMDKEYINSQFQLHENLRGGEPFDPDGNFQSTIWSEPRTKLGLIDRRIYISQWRVRDADKVHEPAA